MKKILITLLVFHLSTRFSNAQIIHNNLVLGSTRPTLSTALNEFNSFYTSYDLLTGDETYIQNTFNTTVNWPYSVLVWVGANDQYGQYVKWTAYSVISYAKTFRHETNQTRRNNYEQKARSGCEFLLWLQDRTNQNGALPTSIANIGDLNVFNTGVACAAFVECYRSFGDQKFYDAAKDICEFLLNHCSYPHTWTNNDPYRYYGNPNHHARALYALAEFYKISGDQEYLDRAIQLAEEIMAWQDYIHVDDP